MTPLPSQFRLLATMLDVTAARHRVIAQNIANVNTPGYRRLELSFDESLAERIQQGEAPDPNQEYTVVSEGESNNERVDGNNVDIDIELGDVGDNASKFNLFSQILAGRIAQMRSAITGR